MKYTQALLLLFVSPSAHGMLLARQVRALSTKSNATDLWIKFDLAPKAKPHHGVKPELLGPQEAEARIWEMNGRLHTFDVLSRMRGEHIWEQVRTLTRKAEIYGDEHAERIERGSLDGYKGIYFYANEYIRKEQIRAHPKRCAVLSFIREMGGVPGAKKTLKKN